MKKSTGFSFPKGTHGEQEIDVHADYVNLLKHHNIYGSSTSNSVDITTSDGVYGEIKARADALKNNAYPQVQGYADTLGHGHDVVFIACRTLAKIFHRNPDGTWPDYTQGVEYKMPQHANLFARDIAKAHGGKKLLTFAEIKRLLLRTSASEFPNREKLAVALALLDCSSIQWSNTSVSFVLRDGRPVPPIDRLTPNEVKWLQGVLNTHTLRNGKSVRRALRFHFYEIKRASTKASNGQVYTPPELVSAVIDMVRPYVRPDHVFVDAAAGCGAFPGEFAAAFQCSGFMSYDIDPWAVNILKYLNDGQQIHAQRLNSLTHAGRTHFPGLRVSDSIIATGNPPWLSRQAHAYQPGAGIVQMPTTSIAKSLQGGDAVLSFMRQYAAIGSEYIALVMPFSVLLKPKKYNSLCFPSNKSRQAFAYELLEARVFSSKLFTGLTGAEFACVLAVFRHGEALTHDQLMQSNRITQLDGRAFPTGRLNQQWINLSSDKGKASPIDVHLFSNYGSVNALCSKGRFMADAHSTSSVAVMPDTLEDYCRLIAIRNHWKDVTVPNKRNNGTPEVSAPDRLRWANARPPRLSGVAANYLIDAFLRYESTSPRADQAFRFAIDASQPTGRLGILWGKYKANPSQQHRQVLLDTTASYIRKRIEDVSRT